jgi:hypothetical protein
MNFEHLCNLKSFNEADLAVDRMLINSCKEHPEIWGPRMMVVLRYTLLAIAYANVGKKPENIFGRDQALLLLSNKLPKKEILSFFDKEIPLGRRERIQQYFIDLYASQAALFSEIVPPAVACL